MIAINPFDFFVEEDAENYPFRYEAALARELAPYLVQSPPGAAVRRRSSRRCTAGTRAPGRAQHRRAGRHQPRRLSSGFATTSAWSRACSRPRRRWTRGHGSCRDFAWLQVQLLRHLGFAARFVSGYSIQLRPDVKPLDGARRASAEDVTDLHAWAEVYLPGAGWIGLDATSGLLAGEGHIPLACTAWPGDRRGDQRRRSPSTPKSEDDHVAEEFDLRDAGHAHRRGSRASPSPTARTSGRPSTRSAHGSTAISQRYDVRLTMGGEPTFVSIDDRDARRVEHRRARADGKRRARRPAGAAAARAVRAGRAPAPRPGQVVPGRAAAALGLLLLLPPRRRADLDATPRCSPRRPVRPPPAPPSGRAGVRRRALADRLGLADDSAQPAYEDIFYYLWRERRLPVNVDVLESRLDDPIERARLARVFAQGLGAGRRLRPAAARADVDDLGRSGRAGAGRCATGTCSCCPGDSPMGYRLPLDGLPWESRGGRAMQIHERDPLAARPPLRARSSAERPRPARAAQAARRPTEPPPAASCAPPSASSRATGCCTSSCRRSSYLEEYLALVAAVEDVAARARRSRCASRATTRPPTTAWTRSRSRPIPASSR